MAIPKRIEFNYFGNTIKWKDIFNDLSYENKFDGFRDE